MDIPGATERAEVLESFLAERGVKMLTISAVTREGVETILDEMVHALDEAGPPMPMIREPNEIKPAPEPEPEPEVYEAVEPELDPVE
jgi:hypothetical protein